MKWLVLKFIQILELLSLFKLLQCSLCNPLILDYSVLADMGVRNCTFKLESAGMIKHTCWLEHASISLTSQHSF